MKSNRTETVGLSFCSLLTIVFVVLKLLGAVSWNWFWVMSPIVFSAVFMFLTGVIGMFIVYVIKKNI